MREISTLVKEELESDEVIKEIEEEVEDYLFHFEFKFAQKLSLALEKKIAEFPDLSLANSERYKKILVKLAFLRLAFLSTKEIEELFKNYFGIFLNYEIDPIEWIRAKLATLHVGADETLREKINIALQQNYNSITPYPLKFPKGEEVKPTITNWLRDYSQKVSEKKDRALARTEYLVNSPNIAPLSSEEKEKVRKLIIFYDFINTSPIIPSGYSKDIIVGWPDGCGSLIAQGETIASWLPPLSSYASYAEKIPSEKKVFPPEMPSSQKTLTPSPAEKETTSLEKKYLEEEEKK